MRRDRKPQRPNAMNGLSCSDPRTVFRETPTGVVLVDEEGCIRVVDQQAADLFSYTQEELERVLEIGQVDDRPEERIQLILYRVIQEAVRNAVQHVDPSRLSVRLREAGDGYLELTVEDDGRGFEPEIVAEGDRFGLLGMRERVEAVGGEIELVSTPGRGTKVRARVPPTPFAPD